MKPDSVVEKKPILESTHSLFGNARWVRILVLIFIFLAAFVIRVYDITDLPLDFNPTSQLNRAIMARGRYYSMLPYAPQEKRDLAIKMWKAEDIEPPFMDGLAALTYLALGKEVIWVPRLFGAIFWIIGGIAVYLLANDFSSHDAAVISTSIYLFLPFGVIASRTFQPDPLMIAFMLFAWWLMYRWVKKPSWKLSILAGILAGLSILAKGVMVFAALAGFSGILFSRGFKQCIKDFQLWTMGFLSVLPTAIYMIYGFFFEKTLGSQLALRVFPNLLIQPEFYLRWKAMIENVVGLGIFILALCGLFLFKDRQKRWFILAFWMGYIVFGLVFAYFFETHNYYHSILIPIVALSLAPLAEVIARELGEYTRKRVFHTLLIAVLLAGLSADLWNIRQVFHKADYRPQVAFWARIGDILGRNPSVIALTQDYGYRLELWGWVMPAGYWPYIGDTAMRQLAGVIQPDFLTLFKEKIKDRKYFLVTDLEEFDKQPELQQILNEYFPVYDQGDGYVIYDLLHPLKTL